MGNEMKNTESGLGVSIIGETGGMRSGLMGVGKLYFHLGTSQE